MARAFIASVPMGVVLVAALVVPLAVIPGTFGFNSWPSSRGERVTERQVLLPAPKIDVVAVRPRKVESRPVLVAVRRVPPRRVPSTTVAPAVTPRRAPIAHVSTPAPKPDRHPSTAPSHPTPTPAQPRTPQPQPQTQEPTKPDSGVLAGGDVPVARELPPQAPPSVAPPVSVAAPVERAVPSEPCHGHGHAYGRQEGGPHGDGRHGE